VVPDFLGEAGTGGGAIAQDMLKLEFWNMSKFTSISTDLPPLDRWRADEVLEGDGKLWGLPHIAKVLGVSVDKARDLAKAEGVPIYRPEGSGSYFAFRSELMAWLRTK
jgi:hypothetical protein